MTKRKVKEAPVSTYSVKYHVTPLHNLDPILKRGIDPARSTGAKEIAWYVDNSMVVWAINHIMKRHDIVRYQVLVLEVQQPAGLFVNAPNPGLFFTYNLFRIVGVYPAENWLAREE